MKKIFAKHFFKKAACMLLALGITIGIAPTTAQAWTCPFERPEGFTEVWGTVSFTYTVGEAFRSREVGLNIYRKNGSPKYYADNLEFFANGNPISDGYQFQEVGQKLMTVKRYDKQATYELQVIPVLNGRLKECILAMPPAKTTYQQSTEGFDPKDIIVQCVFSDGSTQYLGYENLEFYAGARGMENYKWGTAIKEGYRFQEAGDRDLIIRVVNKEMRIPFTVTPFTTKEIQKMELITEPAASYRVGEAFRANDYTFRCYYADGTTEDVNGARLDITANGTRVYDGYKFKEAGTKNMVICLSGHSVNSTLTVTK